MRIAIDFCVDRDELLLMSEVTDTTCAESCINFITAKTEPVTVYLEQGERITETMLQVVRCSARFVLDDTLIRTAGEFAVYASGCMPLRFIVGETIPAGVEYSISLTNGAFYIRRAASAGGSEWIRPKITLERLSNGVLITVTDADGEQKAMVYDGACVCGGGGGAAYSFYINADGHLICLSQADEIPFSIDESGHLIYTYADGTEAMLLSINESGHLIYTTEG